MDVAFISLTKILIPARNLLKTGGRMVCLIKPQFEAGKEKVGKNGVVREAQTHREVISRIIDYADLIGFAVRDLTYSPIKGPEGNIEYLLYLEKREEPSEHIRELSEHEAEEVLYRVVQEGSGLSHTSGWEKAVHTIVAESQKMES